MIDLQKRMGLVPDPGPITVSSEATSVFGRLKPRDRATNSCPRCSGQLIQTPGPWLVCQDCEHFTISLTALNAAKPSGVHVLSSDPSIMSHPDMTRIENAQNSFASGANE